MPASQNNLISVTDYNAIRNIAASVMGVGSASRGYGQVINSIAKNQNQLVSQTDWDNLRFDLLNARIHQAGTGSLQEINENQLIGASAINLYESLRTTIDNNRFAVADGQFLTDGANTNGTPLTTSKNYDSAPWKNEISCTLTVTFADSNRARYFFNSGGTIRIQSSRINTSNSKSDAQNIAWGALLPAPGVFREFGGSNIAGNDANRNFYTLTNTFQRYFIASSSGTYANNRYQLEARSNVANNSSGTANQVVIRIRFIDGYVDPGSGGPPFTDDGVAGTFAVSVSEKRANGIGMILPSGNFTIQRPTYSITALAGS